MTQTEIDQAIVAQLGATALDAAPSNPNIAQALANYVAEASTLAAMLNMSRIDTYHGAFQDWAAAIIGGRTPLTPMPVPPPAWIAAKASNGWTYAILGTDPVCAALPIPPTPGVQVLPKTVFFPSVGFSMNPPPGAPRYELGAPFQLTGPDGQSGTFIAEERTFLAPAPVTIWTRIA